MTSSRCEGIGDLAKRRAAARPPTHAVDRAPPAGCERLGLPAGPCGSHSRSQSQHCGEHGPPLARCWRRDRGHRWHHLGGADDQVRLSLRPSRTAGRELPSHTCQEKGIVQGGRSQPRGAGRAERRALLWRQARPEVVARGVVRGARRLEEVHKVRTAPAPPMRSRRVRERRACWRRHPPTPPSTHTLSARCRRSDGRVWYYHTPSGKMQWSTPDEFKEPEPLAL